MRSDPAVSVPVASGTSSPASAAADPPLDPPGVRSSDHGLPTWSVDPPAAHSCVCRCPTSTAPVARRRAHTSESASGARSTARLEAVSGRPATAYRSFNPSGMPHKGDQASPTASRVSAASAAATASSS